MPDRQDYLERLKTAVQKLHNCWAVHQYSVPVHEEFQGKTFWCNVEIFDLTGHPQAARCYAWSHRSGQNNEQERFVAVLEIPPVMDARTAVRVATEGKK
jgi:hypothetical protein